jgi:serine/threonine protein kinase
MAGMQRESVASNGRIGSFLATSTTISNNNINHSTINHRLDENVTVSYGMNDDNDNDNERSNNDYRNYDDAGDGNDHETTIMTSSSYSSSILPLHSTIINNAIHGPRSSLSKRSHPTVMGASGASNGGSSSSNRNLLYPTESHYQSRDRSSIVNTSNKNGSNGATGSPSSPCMKEKSGHPLVGSTMPNGLSEPMSTTGIINNNMMMKTTRKGSLNSSNNGGGVGGTAAAAASFISPPKRRSSSSATTKDGRRKRSLGLHTLALVVIIVISCLSYLYIAVNLVKASSTTDPATSTNDGGTSSGAKDGPIQLNPGQTSNIGDSDIDRVGSSSIVARSSGDGGPKNLPKHDDRRKTSQPSTVVRDEGGGKMKTSKPSPSSNQKNGTLPATAISQHALTSTSILPSSFPRIVLVAEHIVSEPFHENSNDMEWEIGRRRPPILTLAIPSVPLEPPLPLPRLTVTNTTQPQNTATSSTNNSTIYVREFDLSDVPFLLKEQEDDLTRQDSEKLGESTTTIADNATTSNNVTSPREDDINQQNENVAKESKSCLPMGEWMTASYINCNFIHELDMGGSVSQKDQTDLVLLGEGWFRSAWKYSTRVPSGGHTSASSTSTSTVVLKTLRIEREFLEEYFELHRRDAVAMERLTSSPYVMDVYGYCGQSAINEIAEGMAGGTITSLEQLNRKMRGKESDERFLYLKLQLATSVATGLAHVHNVKIANKNYGNVVPADVRYVADHYDDGSHEWRGSGAPVATMAHYDINPRNIAIMKDGRPKLNDFNIAEFLTYDPATNRSCGFRSRLHEPWWRAPEEMDLSSTTMVTEKVDVYALGNVLFHILTTHSPRGKMKKERMDDVRQHVRAGERPQMLEPYASNKQGLKKHRIVVAFTKAMDLCYESDPEKRGTAMDVAKVLQNALTREEMEQAEQQKKKKSKPSP